MHIPYEIPIYDYKRNTWHLLILFSITHHYFIWFVNIILMKCRNVSPSLLENHSKAQALLLFIPKQHHSRFQLSASLFFSKLTAMTKSIVRGHAHFMNVLAGRGRAKGILARKKRTPRNRNYKKRTLVRIYLPPRSWVEAGRKWTETLACPQAARRYDRPDQTKTIRNTQREWAWKGRGRGRGRAVPSLPCESSPSWRHSCKM